MVTFKIWACQMLQSNILRWAIKFNVSAYRGGMGSRLSLGLGIETVSATAGLISVRLSLFTICSKKCPEHFRLICAQIKTSFRCAEFEAHIFIVWYWRSQEVKGWNCENFANMLNLISKLRKICWNPVNLNINLVQNLNIRLKSGSKDCTRNAA